MKPRSKGIVLLLVLVLMGVSFFAGRSAANQAHREERQQRCQTYLSWAIQKAKTEELQQQSTMEALLSNLYAAYGVCDDPALAAQLHRLWNQLIFERDPWLEQEGRLAETLEGLAQAIAQKT